MENFEKIEPGIRLKLEKVVISSDSASAYGSGMVDVFATPAMIGFMEKTCMNAVLPFLPEGYNTVGTEVCVSHLKATPIGMKVTCEAELSSIEGKKLIFRVIANDELGKIGEGTHTRFIINIKKFMQKISR